MSVETQLILVLLLVLALWLIVSRVTRYFDYYVQPPRWILRLHGLEPKKRQR